MKQRNAVLGLETARGVLVAYLILAVTAVAIILSLTALNNSIGSTIDTLNTNLVFTNDTGSANSTGYTLSGYNSSWSSITLTALWNATDAGAGNYNLSLGVGNASVSSVGVVTNGTATNYENVSISGYYTYTYDSGRADSIVGNVSGGFVTFFGSTGTIFSILIVVVIILAISVIIWAVGRFGQRSEEVEANL